MSFPDGLADLDNKRRKNRVPPPPRHVKREPQTTVPTAEASTGGETPDVSQRAPVTPPERRKPAPKVGTPEEPGDEPIRLVQVYLPQSTDDYLRQVRAEALTHRRDVTASAAVRYAMEELMRTRTPAQLVELLGDKPTTGRRGRSRR